LGIHPERAEAPETPDFLPTIEPPAQKSEHPQIAASPDDSEASAFGEDVAAQTPAIP